MKSYKVSEHKAESVSKFIFELSNKNRIAILQLLNKKNQILTQISKHLNMPASETYRNIKRLVNVGLLVRNEEGKYTLTPVGTIMIQQLSTIYFLEKHVKIFKDHDLSVLPMQFRLSLGNLANIELVEGVIDGFALSIKRFNRATRFTYIMAEHIFEPFEKNITILLKKGVKLKFIFPLKEKAYFFELWKNISIRPKTKSQVKVQFVNTVKLNILIDENSAEMNLPFLNGKIDYALTLFSKDQKEIQFIYELFNYFWTREYDERVYAL